jgi:hypothetical protein
VICKVHSFGPRTAGFFNRGMDPVGDCYGMS